MSLDPELAPLLPRYLSNRRRDADAMAEALAARDFATIRRLGHDLKGTGGSYGFPHLTALGARLEAAAKAEDAEALRIGLAELRGALA